MLSVRRMAQQMIGEWGNRYEETLKEDTIFSNLRNMMLLWPLVPAASEFY